MTAPILLPPLLLSALGLLLAAAPALAQRAPLDPTRVLGVESCRECHDSIVESWERTRHATSFGTMTKSEAAKATLARYYRRVQRLRYVNFAYRKLAQLRRLVS
mgnify:CR=1 FL=1